ncbi:MAG TPA: cell division protein ZapA [Geminicoccaceae bacterium]|jgi:cell division protein ZapA|nr:cell division protein ZapA [Geminicoccaceae bacterium]
MATVEVSVNGRRHMVQCGEGEEARVRQLASYVDRRVSDLARGQTQVGDARLLLMASLLVADELSDAFEEIKRLKAALEGRANGVEEQAAAAVEAVAQELESIAAQLERA